MLATCCLFAASINIIINTSSSSSGGVGGGDGATTNANANTNANTGLEATLVLVFLMNLAAATQDIAVDGLAIEVVDETDLGWANSAQIVGFKVGMLMGGGVLAWVSEELGLGWGGVFAAMAALVLAALGCFTVFGADFDGRTARGGGGSGGGSGSGTETPSPATATAPSSLPSAASASRTSKGADSGSGSSSGTCTRMANTTASIVRRMMRTPSSRAAAALICTYKMGRCETS